MVITCVLCKWKSDFLPKRSFHRFPLNENLKNKWLDVLEDAANLSIKKRTSICSIHFEEDCFKYGLVRGRKILKAGSQPTLHLLRNISSQVLNNDLEIQSHVLEVQNNSFEVQSNILEDINDVDMESAKYSSPGTPMETCTFQKSNLKISNCEIRRLKKEIYMLRRSVKRLTNSNRKIKAHLCNSKKMARSHESEHNSIKSLGPVPQTLYEEMKSSKKKVATYPLPLRVFASTISYLSPKAYMYIRKVFPVLPHASTLRKWMQEIDIQPGICKPALEILKKKSIDASGLTKQLLCNVTVDDMAIRKHVRWTGKTFKGFVTYNGKFNQERVRAKNVMVVMVVCLNENWKIPVAYHFIDSLNGDSRANVLKECFEKIYETGIKAVSLTFDGGLSNISMARKLGADISRSNFNPWFPHPVTNQPVFVLLDACHAIKLVRNATSFYSKIHDGDGNPIEWNYFKKLVAIQYKYGLHAGTKIRKRHVYYFQEKMKVKLATQLLSRSTSAALEFLRNQNLKDFMESFGTEKFCLVMNDVFDILNSRQAYTKKMTRQYINKKNFSEMTIKVSEFENYIKNLRVTDSNILQSRRWLGFYGLIVSMRSCLSVFQTYGMVENPSIQYLLTYKLSQDHLELFFSNVRSRGGYNNNPTVEQFESALKSLLVYADIKDTGSGNCFQQDSTCLLTTNPKRKKLNESVQFKFVNDNDAYNVLNEHNYCLPNIYLNYEHKNYIEEVVAYIAGFVARRINKIVKCNQCRKLVIDIKSNSTLQNFKNLGRLTSASLDLIKICNVAETTLRGIDNIFKIKYPKETLLELTIPHIPRTSMVHNGNDDSDKHRLELVKLILNTFFNVRLHHATVSEFPEEQRIRASNTKSILFAHQ